MDPSAGVASATVRGRAELEASERRFRALSVHSVDLALLADPDGTLTFVSAAARAVLGCEPEDVVGRNGWDFVHRDDLDAAKAAYRLAVEDPDARLTAPAFAAHSSSPGRGLLRARRPSRTARRRWSPTPAA